MFLVKYRGQYAQTWIIVAPVDTLGEKYTSDRTIIEFSGIKCVLIEEGDVLDWEKFAPKLVHATSSRARKIFTNLLMHPQMRSDGAEMSVQELSNYAPYRPYQVIEYWERKKTK